jgi:hypothetical protein
MIAVNHRMYMWVMIQEKICKYWLRDNKILPSDNSGFTKRELVKIEKVIIENYSLILTSFNEFCKGYKK